MVVILDIVIFFHLLNFLTSQLPSFPIPPSPQYLLILTTHHSNTLSITTRARGTVLLPIFIRIQTFQRTDPFFPPFFR